ncbi:MAG: hypothetical protein WC319_08285 [Candidatus Paceibacterota bacterium]
MANGLVFRKDYWRTLKEKIRAIKEAFQKTNNTGIRWGITYLSIGWVVVQEHWFITHHRRVGILNRILWLIGSILT